MDDWSVLEEAKTLQDLLCVGSDFINWEAFVVVVLDVLEQIFVKKFENEDPVLTPHLLFFHPHNVILVIWIIFHELLEEICFILSELMVEFGITVDLNCDTSLLLMVKCLHHLSETTFPKDWDNFKSVP